MKKLLKIVGYLAAFLVLLSVILYVFGFGYLFKGIQTTYLTGHKTAFIDDYPYFDNRIIAADKVQEWPLHKNYNNSTPTQKLQKLHKDLQTAAFLIIKNDSIWFERYFDEYGPKSKTNSFSMAKSITSAMLGKAIKEGQINGLQQPVSDFFPEFDPALTLGDLSSMASGLDWSENYLNPFGVTARSYFDTDIRKLILGLEVVNTPGEKFKYQSGNTQLLAMFIEKATGKTLSDYLSENFWQPMGMNSDALWQLDSRESGMEKAFCCIASNARNFAKFGKLYSHYGNWNGEQLLDSSFVKKSIQPRFEDSPYYGYGFWLSDYKNKQIFYMRGVHGQYVIAIPKDQLLIVRLGSKVMSKSKDEKHYPDFYIYIDEVYKMLDDAS